jgi:hypothetical protein
MAFSAAFFLVLASLASIGCGGGGSLSAGDGGAANSADGSSSVDERPSTCPSFHVAQPDLRCIDADGGAITKPVLLLACGVDSDAGAGGRGLEEDEFEHEEPVEIDDDECKFHVVMRRTCNATPGPLNFLVAATQRSDGSPAMGAEPYFEAFLGLTHVAPNSGATAAEVSPGTYTIGPLFLDQPGRWTLILHLYGRCSMTAPATPHAHATFTMDVL